MSKAETRAAAPTAELRTLPPFDARTTRTIAALFDTVVPADEYPGGWDGGGYRLLREHLDGFLGWAVPALQSAAATLNDARSTAYADLDADERAHVLSEALAAEDLTDLEVAQHPPDWERRASERPLDTAVDLVFHSYYGGTRRPSGWDVVGFDPLPEGITATSPEPLTGVFPEAIGDDYDIIVVGGGGGGGFAAYELARRGRRVLLVERSRAIADAELRDNHLQGKRAELYDVIAGPGKGSPRVLEREDGTSQILPGDGSGTNYGLVAFSLGGGTRVWQGMSWRFLAEDFQMASVYGVPDGSTLVDWPIGYGDLEPYYQRVEHELGVAGDSSSSAATRAPRTTALPMPALRDNGLRAPYSEAASRLGWESSSIPTAINSVPRDGRGACVGCAQCVGHSCPVDAKNGTHNTVIPKAIATGNCDLLMGTQVVEILHDGRGNATGVRAFSDSRGLVRELRIRARHVVVAAGAMETPRLLLASGLGNSWVGRNHHTHGGAAATTLDAPITKTWQGPNHSVSTLEFVHANAAPWGGGVIFDLPATLPVMKAQAGRAVASFGAAHKQWMKEAPNMLGTMSMVQEIPHELSRVSIDPRVRDRFGMPVARLRGAAHPASAAAAEFMRERCVDWLAAVGSRNIQSHAYPGGSRGAEHSAGSVRMGNDPAAAACDAQGRLFGTSNVFVADASLHPTNGGFNPGLTAMACGLRVATLMP